MRHVVLRGLISPGPNGVSLRFHFCPDGFRVIKSTCVFGSFSGVFLRFFNAAFMHFGARRTLGSRTPDTEYLTSIDSLPSWSRTVVLQQASPAPSSTGGLSSSPAPAWSDQEVVA